MAGWDCHAHLFGPYARFPLAPQRSYTPPEALDHQYQALLSRLGLSHGVLVHPSAYGEDFSLLLDALDTHDNLRGVVVLRPEMLDRGTLDLSDLRARGVRAARFSHRSAAGANFAGSASFDDLLSLAPRLADAGLHAELWTDTQALPGIAAQLRGLPVRVVIDHAGVFDVQQGVDAPGFQTLLSLLSQGQVWVKLCVYRNLLQLGSGVGDVERGRPFQEALVQANPEALVWGSDWPHLRVDPAPDAADLLTLCRRWTPDAQVLTRILQSNPARLYA